MRNEGVAEQYVPACPDVLEVKIRHRPDLSGRRAIGPDGRIDLGRMGRLRVEGRTLSEVAERLAELAETPPGSVQVRVAEFNSQQVYVFGQVFGLQRAVAYQGPETVSDLLQRVGGITAGAAPGDVYVVRSRIARGQPPQVFRVDLRAIVLGRDERTNLGLQPFDQIYVGETRRSSLEKCIPPWLRPLYESLSGLRRRDQKAAVGQAASLSLGAGSRQP